MSRTLPKLANSDPSDRLIAADILFRQEPEEEEDKGKAQIATETGNLRCFDLGNQLQSEIGCTCSRRSSLHIVYVDKLESGCLEAFNHEL